MNTENPVYAAEMGGKDLNRKTIKQAEYIINKLKDKINLREMKYNDFLNKHLSIDE